MTALTPPPLSLLKVGQSVVQLAKSRGIITISVVKDSTDATEMVGLLKNLGGDVVCAPHYAVSHRFKELISDLSKPVLSIHYADNLDVSVFTYSIISICILYLCFCFHTGPEDQIYPRERKHENVWRHTLLSLFFIFTYAFLSFTGCAESQKVLLRRIS